MKNLRFVLRVVLVAILWLVLSLSTVFIIRTYRTDLYDSVSLAICLVFLCWLVYSAAMFLPTIDSNEPDEDLRQATVKSASWLQMSCLTKQFSYIFTIISAIFGLFVILISVNAASISNAYSKITFYAACSMILTIMQLCIRPSTLAANYRIAYSMYMKTLSRCNLPKDKKKIISVIADCEKFLADMNAF
jgi:hypothetical protein